MVSCIPVRIRAFLIAVPDRRKRKIAIQRRRMTVMSSPLAK
jgi:hypothetical protein